MRNVIGVVLAAAFVTAGAQTPVIGPGGGTSNSGGSSGSGPSAVVVEHTFGGGGGSLTFAHNLNTPNPLYSCISKSGASTSALQINYASVNSFTIQSPGAADVVCTFSYVAGPGGGGTQTTPTITWADPAAIDLGTALSSTQLNASSGGVDGTFVYTPPSGTVLTAGTQTLSTTFSPTNTATYAEASGTATLVVNPWSAYWPCHDGSGTSCAETAGGAPLTMTGGTFSSVTGFSGTVPTFTSGALYVSDATKPFDFGARSQAWSVSMWVKPTAIPSSGGSTMTIFATGNLGVTNALEFAVDWTGLVLITASDTVGGIQAMTDGGVISAGTLTNLVVTYDGSNNCANVKAYANGVALTMTLSSYCSMSNDFFTTLPPTFMASPVSTGVFTKSLPGSISKPTIYNYVVSPSYVTNTIYAGGS